jgi:asparagine synthase (glutamine-hydrolysing)
MVEKGKLEKQILRDIFSEYLPESIIKRQKEQFSDGVGYSWIDKLKEYTNEHITDENMENAKFKFPINTPLSKEAYYYRDIFNQFYPTDSEALTVPFEASVACSTAKALEWDESLKNVVDPSGRSVLSVHVDSY